FRAGWFLYPELAAFEPDRMHSQGFAGLDLTHGTITNHQYLLCRESGLLLDLPERRLFGKNFSPVGIQDGLYRRLTVQPECANLPVLNMRLAKAHYEIAHPAFMQKAQQGLGARKQS